MFESDGTITRRVDQLWSLCAPLVRGQVLGHDQIMAVLGCQPHEEAWSTCLSKLRRRMEDERGITLWPEYGRGYRLLTYEEQLQVPLWRQQRALRQVQRGVASLEALSERELTHHQRRVRAFRLRTARLQAETIQRELRAQRLQARPPESRPRPPALFPPM